MNRDLPKIQVHFSKVNWASISAHGADRGDGAGADLYVRVGPIVVGVPHGWRPFAHLRQLAHEKQKLLAELELTRFDKTGKFS